MVGARRAAVNASKIAFDQNGLAHYNARFF
jgi:hypothetical protein